jgi:hypothetical protein
MFGVGALGYVARAIRNYFVGSSLDLRFTGADQTLDPRVTFTRTSNATVTDSTGTLVYAPHNLLTFSESFDNAAWAKTSVTVTANSAVAPDGTTTADTLTDSVDATAAAHAALPASVSFSSGVSYTVSLYAKQGTLPGVSIVFPSAAFTSFLNARFNIATGAVANLDAGLTGSITDVGNGWYRCSATATATASASNQVQIRTASSTTSFYQGTGTGTIFVWGAQLNVGSLQTYYPTTRKNLLGFTQEFDNAAWTKSNTTVTANAAIDPQGFMTADKLVEDTASISHQTNQAFTPVNGGVYTGSIFVKAGERGFAFVGFTLGSIATTFITVDLSTGVVSNAVGTPLASSSVPLGNGWYRVSVSQASSGTTISTFGVRTSVDGIYANRNYTGDGTSGIFIWGAQLSDSASLDPYVYNPGAAPASTAYFGPRFDYDPVTLAPKGLLIEESRTNLLTRSIPDAGVPTGWSVGFSTGTFSHTLVSAPSRYAGLQQFIKNDQTVVGRSFLQQAVTLSANTTYTLTVVFDKTQSSITSSDQTVVSINDFSDATGTLSTTLANVPADGVARLTFTTGTDTTGNIRVGCGCSFNTVASLVFGAWQLEAGAFATSYIPTTTAAATRAADVAVMQGANFGNWFSQPEGTFYVEWNTSAAGTNRYLIDAQQVAGSGNRIDININTSNVVNPRTVVGGSAVASLSGGTYSASSNGKIAFAYKSADYASSFNGASAVIATTAGALPTPDILYIGSLTGAAPINGYIRRLTYFPRRLSASELQGVTA